MAKEALYILDDGDTGAAGALNRLQQIDDLNEPDVRRVLFLFQAISKRCNPLTMPAENLLEGIVVARRLLERFGLERTVRLFDLRPGGISLRSLPHFWSAVQHLDPEAISA